MNDRVLRNIVVGLGAKADGVVREDHFVITVASEIMAILCLADDMDDLKARLAKIVVAYNYQGEPVTAADLKAVGAMAALLKDALKPNLIQTLEHTPAIVHGGPFANIAHGCNSVRATKAALKMADYTITEAGFGADLGAEKFFRYQMPDGRLKAGCSRFWLQRSVHSSITAALQRKTCLQKIWTRSKRALSTWRSTSKTCSSFGVPVVVTLNSFLTDTEAETNFVQQFCEERGCEFALSNVWAQGGEGGIALAEKVLKTLEEKERSFCSAVRRKSSDQRKDRLHCDKD